MHLNVIWRALLTKKWEDGLSNDFGMKKLDGAIPPIRFVRYFYKACCKILSRKKKKKFVEWNWNEWLRHMVVEHTYNKTRIFSIIVRLYYEDFGSVMTAGFSSLWVSDISALTTLLDTQFLCTGIWNGIVKYLSFGSLMQELMKADGSCFSNLNFFCEPFILQNDIKFSWVWELLSQPKKHETKKPSSPPVACC